MALPQDLLDCASVAVDAVAATGAPNFDQAAALAAAVTWLSPRQGALGQGPGPAHGGMTRGDLMALLEGTMAEAASFTATRIGGYSTKFGWFKRASELMTRQPERDKLHPCLIVGTSGRVDSWAPVTDVVIMSVGDVDDGWTGQLDLAGGRPPLMYAACAFRREPAGRIVLDDDAILVTPL
jgi:hypothetical protein